MNVSHVRTLLRLALGLNPGLDMMPSRRNQNFLMRASNDLEKRADMSRLEHEPLGLRRLTGCG